MEVKDEDEYKKNYSPFVKRKDCDCSDVILIEKTDDYTIISIMYSPCQKNISAWWFQIERNTFIRPVGSDEKHYIVKTKKIPFAPKKSFRKGPCIIHAFSLYFPKLPNNVLEIDIIERENTNDWFNFYGVSMDKSILKDY